MENTPRKNEARPVTIISGFLGAGKTSFLNEWMQWQKNARPAIIENEFGKEGIDAGLLIAPDSDIFELNSGCLCCSLNDDLVDLLENLLTQKTHFDELFIETTGIADPAGVAQPFIALPEIARFFQLERVICIVDAKLISFQLRATSEARKQIAFADIIVVNKCDMIDAPYLQQIIGMLKGINPFAAVFSGSIATGYPLQEITSLTRSDFDSRLASVNEQSKAAFQPGKDKAHSIHDLPQHHHHHHHHHDITSLSFVYDKPFNLKLFEYRLMVFLNFQATDIYRVKGFLWAAGEQEKIIVQSVANLLAITEGERWDEGEKQQSRIVFIGKDLKAKGLDAMLKECLTTSSVSATSTS